MVYFIMAAFNLHSGVIPSLVWKESCNEIIDAFIQDYTHIDYKQRSIFLFSIPDELVVPVTPRLLSEAHVWDTSEIFSVLQNIHVHMYGMHTDTHPIFCDVLNGCIAFIDKVHDTNPLIAPLCFKWLAQFLRYDYVCELVEKSGVNEWAWNDPDAYATLTSIWKNGMLPPALWQHLTATSFQTLNRQGLTWMNHYSHRIDPCYQEPMFLAYLTHCRGSELNVTQHLIPSPSLAPALIFALYLAPENERFGYNAWLSEHYPSVMCWIEERERSNQLSGECYITVDDWNHAYTHSDSLIMPEYTLYD